MATATIAPAGPIPAGPGQPASSPAQDHVRRLHASGGTYSGIAAAAGLARTTVRDLASGRRPATPYTTTAVLAVTTVTPPRTPLDAGGTRLRLRALHVMGHGCVRIARAAGAHPDTIRALVRADATTISPKLRDVIIGVYDAWWDKRAPERTSYERGAATTNDTIMTSDQTAHTARHAPEQNGWAVSWLPGQILDRNTAITAMILADTTAQAHLQEGHRLWPFVQGWAGELGLTAPDAIAQASQPPSSINHQQEPASRQPDREAAD